MSTKYPGGIISKTAPTPSGPYADSTAPGVWTLEQQAYWQKLGQWPTAGNVNPSAFIENLFSTWLYTGSNSTQTITNGIDLSTYGGLVWTKARTTTYNNCLTDTVRGGDKQLFSNTTDASTTSSPAEISSFNTTGYTLAGGTVENVAGQNFVGWTFREQPKFFDVVTYTGNGTNGRTVAHSLGSTPGCIIVKRTDASNGWAVYHRAMNASPQDYMMRLNATDGAFTTTPSRWNNTLPTSTEFTLSGNDEVNGSGATYVAYLFAHDAGGFGLTGTDNVITCGSFTTDSSWNATVNLGYEPQFILFKSTSYVDNWYTVDTMRGWSVVGGENYVSPNLSNAEANYSAGGNPTATGFQINTGNPSSTYIYIAIRRGPMAVPTLGTSVFAPQVVSESTTGPNYTNTITSNFPVDWVFTTTSDTSRRWGARLIGNAVMSTNSSAAETNFGLQATVFDSNTSAGIIGTLGSTASAYMYAFKRAPSFFDEVCWTGTGSGSQAITHNLGVAPEFTITKRRSGTGNWSCFPVMFGINTGIYLDSTAALQTNAALHPTLPTATTYYTNDASWGDENIGGTFVTYLFATCAGVSKVGSYTGTGTTLQVDCGFTGGARFVLIKRTDSTGDWYVWDSARGIVAGNDPYLLLNSTAAEVTGTDYVDTYSAGFEISSTAPSAINASGGTFIFLAIA